MNHACVLVNDRRRGEDEGHVDSQKSSSFAAPPPPTYDRNPLAGEKLGLAISVGVGDLICYCAASLQKEVTGW